MKKESLKTLSIVTIFAIAMAFLETAVVIYLRKLFYPNGFNFPLTGIIDPSILHIEWLREFATIVMLVTIACLASKRLYGRFAYFLYAFAIWDIFYYILLKLTLNWPASFLTWDLLFLIPWPWIGPVIAPIVCSVLFIILSFMIINFEDRGKKVRFEAKEWILFIAGVIVILYSWLIDYAKIIFSNGVASNYIPMSYNWMIFSLGIILMITGILIFYSRTARQR